MNQHKQKVLNLAKEAFETDEVPIGAIVVMDGEIVGEARNEKEASNDPTAHAEVLAIRRACKRLGDWRLQGGILVTSLEPCPMCLASIAQARIQKVICLAEDPKGGAVSLGYRFHKDERLNHAFEVVFEPEEESSELLKRFFRNKREKS